MFSWDFIGKIGFKKFFLDYVSIVELKEEVVLVIFMFEYKGGKFEQFVVFVSIQSYQVWFICYIF